jgi:hypothetical protein
MSKFQNTMTLSRRTALLGLSTTAALGATSVTAAPAAQPADPIFAAITRYEAAHGAFLTRCDHESDIEEAGGELISAPDDYRTPEMVHAVEASVAARERLAETAPTTLAGLAAYLDFVASESESLEDFLFCDEEVDAFIRSLARSARCLSDAA